MLLDDNELAYFCLTSCLFTVELWLIIMAVFVLLHVFNFVGLYRRLEQ